VQYYEINIRIHLIVVIYQIYQIFLPKVLCFISLIEPVVSHDKPGGADHSTNDRDVLLRANSVLFTGLNPGYFYVK